MYKAFSACLIMGAVLALGSLTNLIGFSYPRVIPDQPLQNPMKVVSVEGRRFVLEDGRAIDVEANDDRDLRDQLGQSKFMVDIEVEPDGTTFVYGNQNGFVCGTNWAQPIRIPLFPVRVYRNRREIIALGRIGK